MMRPYRIQWPLNPVWLSLKDTKRRTEDMGRMHVKMKAETRVMATSLERPRSPANPQKLEGRHRTDSPEGSDLPDSFIPNFWPPELGENTALLLKSPSVGSLLQQPQDTPLPRLDTHKCGLRQAAARPGSRGSLASSVLWVGEEGLWVISHFRALCSEKLANLH